MKRALPPTPNFSVKPPLLVQKLKTVECTVLSVYRSYLSEFLKNLQERSLQSVNNGNCKRWKSDYIRARDGVFAKVSRNKLLSLVRQRTISIDIVKLVVK
ncbi:hypothetical protein PROFUN_12670 [Planoprotostelium fungivorum]|uniref:Uncharacterized protein n=1 Tax=Planoprotostelium fungivorum TaxID=1890364 RepID=A0A2P6MTW0_9EUKA|nr:hypothetical protein PROFUN_15982 [Planoprotostelium fungivorum]PRP79736.1 hypothetical protein PROFUN_12670 [Planoprotostelium fungivorum]